MSRTARQRFLTTLQNKLEKALEQDEKIGLAAEWVAKTQMKNGWIYASGTGHSHIFAEEIFYRAGGFARVRPIFDSRLMLHENASASTGIERQEGLACSLFGNYKLGKDDVLVLASNSGRNAVPIELALEAKKQGAKTICLTNLTHSAQVQSRHSSGLKLYEVCDLSLDNFGDWGDASTKIVGISTKMGATSTIIGAAILHAILLEATELLVQEGHKPEIFSSSNTDQGEKDNLTLIEKYKNQIKGL